MHILGVLIVIVRAVVVFVNGSIWLPSMLFAIFYFQLGAVYAAINVHWNDSICLIQRWSHHKTLAWRKKTQFFLSALFFIEMINQINHCERCWYFFLLLFLLACFLSSKTKTTSSIFQISRSFFLLLSLVICFVIQFRVIFSFKSVSIYIYI